MRRGRTLLLLTSAVIAGALASSTWSQPQPGPDTGDQASSIVAPPARAPLTKLKPREDAQAAPATQPQSLASASSGDDQDNPEMPSSSAAAKSAADKPVEPLKRPRYAVAILQALDKVTAETVRFEAPVNQPVRYKTLVFTVHACETTAADETGSDAIAHVEVDNQPKAPEGAAQPASRQVFKGWMYASSPGLNLFQHPIYDAWLIACKTATPSA
jgi:hypothetical protein